MVKKLKTQLGKKRKMPMRFRKETIIGVPFELLVIERESRGGEAESKNYLPRDSFFI